jgi:hypothetical protein
MLIQIALGSSLMLGSILIAGVSFWVMEVFLLRYRPWLSAEPHRLKVMFILCIASVWILVQLSAGVWLWAITLWALNIFVTLETSVYFSLVAFTTLGFGDILLPTQWRLLGGMAAANGLLNMGLLTAVLVEALRQVRISQLETLRGKK